MKLEQYFEAYDNTHSLAGGCPEWGIMRRKIRWSLARPVLELAGQVAFLLGCLALGWWGSPIGYLLALGTLCFMPQYVSGLRAQITAIRGLADEGELRKLLGREAQRRIAGAVLAFFWHGMISLLFLAFSAVAAWLGRDFTPGLVAGLLVGAIAVHALLIRLPRASREMAALERDAEKPNGGKEREHVN